MTTERPRLGTTPPVRLTPPAHPSPIYTSGLDADHRGSLARCRSLLHRDATVLATTRWRFLPVCAACRSLLDDAPVTVTWRAKPRRDDAHLDDAWVAGFNVEARTRP